MKHYESVLPDGYEPIGVVDAKNKKVSMIFTVVSLLITVAIVTIGALLLEFSFAAVKPWKLLIFALGIFGYILLHELVHGAAYKLLTKQKLTFGMTLTVAFCGVPDIYVYRKAALIALLAPFVTFTVAYGALLFALPLAFDKFLVCILMGLHVGGCCGDLYVTGLYLFKYRDSTTLMQDTGPKQTFYLKK